jgi:DNA-binding transcriptional LysR family regulator
MDRLDELRLFVAILDAGSLAGAARRLGHSPPVVTRSLAALEDRLGVRLLERSTRRSRPTAAGERLAVQARHLLGDYDAALAEAAGDAAAPRGPLRIAAPLVFGRRHVAPLVAEFLAAQPRVTAELVLSDRYADLLEEGLDVALRIGALADAALVARRVGAVRIVAAASPAYLAARGEPATPEALAGHEVLHFAAPGQRAEWVFAAPGGARLPVAIAPRFTVNAAEAAIDAAIAGRGIVRTLSYQLADALADGRLRRILGAFEPPASPVSLVFASARLLPARLRAFLDFAAPRLAALPALREAPATAPPPPTPTRPRRPRRSS